MRAYVLVRDDEDILSWLAENWDGWYHDGKFYFDANSTKLVASGGQTGREQSNARPKYHIMVDIETLGITHDAKVLQIGLAVSAGMGMCRKCFCVTPTTRRTGK